MSNSLADSIYGSLIGGAIGDALGAPVEMMDYWSIRETHGGPLESFISSEKANQGATYLQDVPGVPGAFTDDTTMRYHLCQAIVERGGRPTPDDYARVLLARLNPNRVWYNERILLQKLRIGMNPWDTGRGMPPTGCASMLIAPIGIIDAADPDQAYRDAFAIAGTNQDGFDRDAAATIAAGIAQAFVPGATIESIVRTMYDHSTAIVRRSIYLGEQLALGSASVDEFAEGFYAKLLDWKWPDSPGAWQLSDRYYVSASSVEILPATVGVLLLTGDDTNRAIIEGASFGRDCDTIGKLAGEFCGALHGASSIREDWISDSENANAPFFEEAWGSSDRNHLYVARELEKALDSVRLSAHERARQLDGLLP